MKHSEIKVGGHYTASVGGKVVTVRVDKIERTGRDSTNSKRGCTIYFYHVTNLATSRRTTFRSAAKFRSSVKSLNRLDEGQVKAVMEASEEPSPTLPESEPDHSADSCKGRYSDSCEEDSAEANPTMIAENSLTETVSELSAVQRAMNLAQAVRTNDLGGLAAGLANLHKPVMSNNGQPPHVEVRALAGTGKTTTIIEGMKSAKGLPVSIKPSDQQAAVWEQLKVGRNNSVMFGAFGRDIASVLKERLQESGLNHKGCDAKTMHGMGYKAVLKAFGETTVNEDNDKSIICGLLGVDPRQLRKDKPQLLSATADLVDLCKLNLVEATDETLFNLARRHDIDLGNEENHSDISAEVFDLVPRVLERCKEPKGSISFSDMVWLPNVLNLRMWKHDIFLGDEVQDWNRAQQGIALKAGNRLVLVGDVHQSIMAFAGADSESMDRMVGNLLADRGCTQLRLTVTRRCSKAVVEEAKQYVPEFEAHESNPDGKVSRARWPIYRDAGGRWCELPEAQTYLPLVKDGDMVLCRTNAPLISQCFKHIAAGRKAFILGKKIGEGLIALIEKFNTSSINGANGLVHKLDDWLANELGAEQALRFPSENRMMALTDKHHCLMTLAKGASTPADLVGKINSIFTDQVRQGIRHSSIHKSKGLESKRVFLLQPPDSPRPSCNQEYQQIQEDNLQYVGITRAIEELTYVS